MTRLHFLWMTLCMTHMTHMCISIFDILFDSVRLTLLLTFSVCCSLCVVLSMLFSLYVVGGRSCGSFERGAGVNRGGAGRRIFDDTKRL